MARPTAFAIPPAMPPNTVANRFEGEAGTVAGARATSATAPRAEGSVEATEGPTMETASGTVAPR